jgi:flagellar hook-basal body complex protein FliE
MNALTAIRGAASSGSIGGIQKPQAGPSADSFGGTLNDAISKVDNLQKGADATLHSLASGEKVDLHGTMIALEEADIALRTMVSVRNKLVGAYEQVMNMAI